MKNKKLFFKKKLAHEITKMGKSTDAVCAGSLLTQERQCAVLVLRPVSGDPGESMVQTKSRGNLQENPLLFKGAGLFVPFRPSTDWVNPAALWRAIYLLNTY